VIVLLGITLGPIQPVALELAAECTYPISEATMTAFQQLCGNIVSASFVPILLALRDAKTGR